MIPCEALMLLAAAVEASEDDPNPNQLLMHRLDVLLALSSSNADPAHSCVQWEAVSAALWEAEALPTLMRLLPALPPPLLPIGFALLAEW